jgi:mannose-6-phosphate isomerase-like protein (cupin superfamily)
MKTDQEAAMKTDQEATVKTEAEHPVEPYVLGAGEGESTWFLATRMTVKATRASTGGSIGLVEALIAPGFAPPLHVHHAEDEPMWVLEGDVTFTCGDRTLKAGPGSFVYLPRDVPHTFRVEGDTPARILVLHLPAGFEQFYVELGTPALNEGLPPPEPPDFPRILAVMARYGVEYPAPPQSASQPGDA